MSVKIISTERELMIKRDREHKSMHLKNRVKVYTKELFSDLKFHFRWKFGILLFQISLELKEIKNVL